MSRMLQESIAVAIAIARTARNIESSASFLQASGDPPTDMLSMSHVQGSSLPVSSAFRITSPSQTLQPLGVPY